MAPSFNEVVAAASSLLRQRLPHLLAVYVFGSRASGASTSASDWDIALWVAGKLDPLAVWSLANDLAQACGAEVDLVDLRSASTVMQYEVITTAQRVWARDASVDGLEAMALYQTLLLSITVAIITQHLAELKVFSKHRVRSLLEAPNSAVMRFELGDVLGDGDRRGPQ